MRKKEGLIMGKRKKGESEALYMREAGHRLSWC